MKLKNNSLPLQEILAVVKSHCYDEVRAFGHPNVRGDHPTTVEITTEAFLTPRGNCIIGINASKPCHSLSPDLKRAVQANKEIGVFLYAGDDWDYFRGRGDPRLALSDKTSIVFRKSGFISDRTALINCSKTAKDLNRAMIEALKAPTQELWVYFCNISIEEDNDAFK